MNTDPLPFKRLLGARVCLGPMPDWQVSYGGLIVPNVYQKANIHFIVLAVGPGEWEDIPHKNKRRWISVEVAPGDRVISPHWLQEPQLGWHRDHYLDSQDQSGRVVVDARRIVAAWRPQPDHETD
jgi:co-chaperonin GroES (HSP10)